MCGRAQRAGARLRAGLAALPGVVSVRGAGLLLAAQLATPTAKEIAAAALEAGLLVNPVRPDAIRVAPPLLVSDDEIDAALAILGAVMGDRRPAAGPAPRPDRRPEPMPDLFDVDDLWPDDYDRVLELATSDDARPGARRARRGPALREAVGPHPQLHRDGRVRPGRPPGLHPGGRGRPRYAGVRRGHRPHARLLPPHPVRPRLRPRGAGAHGLRPREQRLRRAGDQPALRRGAPLPGHRRRAHAARAARPAARPGAGLHRRRQQHVPLPGQGGADGGDGCPGGLAPGLLVFGRGTRPPDRAGASGSAAAARCCSPTIPRSPPAAPTRSTPTCGRAWARRRRGPSALAAFAGFTIDDALLEWPSPTSSCCTACRRTGARRSRPRSSRVRTAWCGSRPPTARPPCGGSWPGRSRSR